MTDNPKTMTAEDRARKIWDEIPRDLGADRWIDYLACQIQQAVDQARKEGFEQAREMSTKVAREIEDAFHDAFPGSLYPGVSKHIADLQPPREGAE